VLPAVYFLLIGASPRDVYIRVSMYLNVGEGGAGAGIRQIDLETGRYSGDMEFFNLTYPYDGLCPDVRYWITIVLNETASQPLIWNYSISFKPEYLGEYTGYVIHSFKAKGSYRLTADVHVELKGISRIADSLSRYVEIL